MRTLILQNSKDTPPGSTLEWLKKNNFPTQLIQLFNLTSFELPLPDSFELLVICGGAMNVDEEHKFPWLKPEKNLIKAAIDANKHVLGLCLGGQLIAEGLGARVGKHPVWECGWQNVKISALPNSVLFKEQILKSFQFHGYSFDTPPGAISFATNQACQHQGYVYKDKVVGFQFHPETTKEWATECANEPELPIGEFCQTKEQILSDLECQPKLQEWYFNFLNQWLLKK